MQCHRRSRPVANDLLQHDTPLPFPHDPLHTSRETPGARPIERRVVYRLDLATRSNSSFFLMAYELDEPLAALMSSSERHSARDLVEIMSL